MKVLLILACLTLCLVHSQAQLSNCRGRPSRPECVGLRNIGERISRVCDRHANILMWYSDRRQRACMPMPFLGCGGNANRFCTRQDCQRACWREG